MKLLKVFIAFIALVSLQIAAAQWLNVPPPVEAKNLMIFTAGVPVVSPPAGAYYYGADATDCAADPTAAACYPNSTSWTSDEAQGDNITVGATGNITKMGVKIANKRSTNIKLMLVNQAGEIHQCTEVLNASLNSAAWNDITITTPLAVSASDEVKVFILNLGVIDFYYNGSTGGYYCSWNYSTPGCISVPTQNDDFELAVRVYVE